MSRRIWPAVSLLIGLAISSPGFAQNAPEEELPSPTGLDPGWNASLSINGNASFTSQQDVVGQTDGTSALLGLSLSGESTFVSGNHEWLSSLAIEESFARTASLPEFVKNSDSVVLDSLYQYYFVDWAGVYGHGAAQTSIFANNRVTGSPTDYRVVRPGGEVQVFRDETRFRMTDPFVPTSIDESAGAFVKPIRREKVTVAVRSGLAARQTLTGDALVADDSGETPEVDLEELSDVFQGGFELFAGVSGKFPERRFDYRLGVTGFLPVVDNDVEDRSPTELARIGVNGKLTFQAFDWLGASYGLQVVRDPQLVDETQVTNNLFLNLSYTLVDTDEEDEEESASEEGTEDDRDSRAATTEASERQRRSETSDEPTSEENATR